MTALQGWSAVFYAAPSGRSPVRDWLGERDQEVQERTVALLQALRDHGARVGMPHARHLRGKIWELRVRARSGEYRLLYATVSGQRILLLHGFKKTTQETPPRKITLAEERLADFESREG